MKALSDTEFLQAEGMEDEKCRSCGGKLESAVTHNLDDFGRELPRFGCKRCGEIYEQTDDYGV